MDGLITAKSIQELPKIAASPACPVTAGPDAANPRRGGWAGICRALEAGEGRLTLLAGALFIVLLVFIAYRPILPGTFLMDDQRLIEEDNPITTGQLGPGSIWFRTEWALSTFVFWLQWLAWGARPGWYHAVNMALHALSAVLLWRFLARLKIPGGWLAGAIFAAHPVAVASVARIAEMKNTLSLPFFLLAALFYVRYEDASLPRRESVIGRQEGRAPLWYGLALVSFILALLSKTSTVMLPLALLGLAAFRRGRISGRDLICTGPFFVVALAFGLMSAWFQKHVYLAGLTLAQQSFGERLAVAGRAFWFYLGKALWPANLNLVYPHWRVDASSALSYLPALLIAAAFLICWRSRRGWGRPALLGLGVYGVTLFPALGFFDSQFLTRWQVSDHLQYLPMIAPVALAAAGLAALLPGGIFRGAGAVLVLVLTALTFARAEIFAKPETLYRDTLAKNPGAWAARNDLGVILAATNLPAAVEQFTASLELNPDNPDAHANLAQAMAMQGKLDRAEAEFRKALALKPLDAQIHRNFAATLGRLGKQGEAAGQLQTALSIKADLPTQLELAELYFQESDLRQAETQYRRALRLEPDCVEALNNLGWLLATASDDKLRDGAEAVHLAERAQRLPPVKGMCVAGTLAAAYAEAGRFSEAVATAEKAVRNESAEGETRFADLNRQLLIVYRAGKPWHGTIAKSPNRFGVGDNAP